MNKKIILVIIGILVVAGIIAAVLILQKPEPKTVIYVTIVSHNEDDDERYGSYNIKEGYLEFRDALLKMVDLIMKYNASYDFQPEWKFLEAALKYEKGDVLKNTNNKNILRYFKEDLGIQIDPHSHEGYGYNYADVAYLIKQLGVEPSNVVGGFLAYPNIFGEGEIVWEKFREPLKGQKYDYTWNTTVLWGGAVLNHQGDEHPTSGVYRPKNQEEFRVHDPSGNLIVIGTGGYLGNLEKLIDDIYISKKAPSDKMYTLSIMFMERDVWLGGEKKLLQYETILKEVDSYVKQGSVKWATLSEIVEIWKTEYNSEPNIYECESIQQLPGEAGGAQEKCGDGICDEVERQTGKCPEDCD